MNIRLINFIVALFFSALISYGLWSVDGPLHNYVAIGSFLFLAGTLVPAIGIEFEYARRAVNLRMTCGVFFGVGLIFNLICALLQVGTTIYIISSAIVFLVFVLIANGVYAVRQ